ncbi:hypothetical protein SUGI_1178780 [Cryptomeria japonica]|nr:hypothetical protein SUGI_1178780 [Cryptomeria japonica]
MGFSDVYDWICYVCESGGSTECKIQSFKQIVLVDNPFSLELCAHYDKGQVSLSLQLLKIGSMQHTLIADLGRIFDIHKRRQELMQHNLLPLSSLLFWGLISPLSPDYEDIELSRVLRFSFLQSLLGIEERIIEPSKYEQLFNSLIAATCSSFASYIKRFGLGKDECNASMLSSPSEIQAEAQEKALLVIGAAGTHRVMYLWASRFTAESLACKKEYHYPSMLKTYKPNIGEFWRIASYSPLLSMEISNGSLIAENHLQRALSYHLLQCIFQFGHRIKFCKDWIEVCLEMDNVRCDVCPLNPMYLDLESSNILSYFPEERHFPSKICLTIGPENGCDVHSVSLTLSSRNPLTENVKGNTYEATFELLKNVGLKASSETSSTEKINNWGFEQSVVNYSDAKIDCTLYDSTTGKGVFNNGPPKFSVLGPKTWFIDRYSKACRAFTEEGGVVFAKDDFGKPITWRLNKDLEGKTLKWIVKGTIWLTYLPNAYHTRYSRYSETRRHDFHKELDLALVKSASSAPD